MRTLTASIALGLLALVAQQGCVSSSKTEVDSHSTTVGQELQDLEAARNKGLLTEAEYQKQRQEIMNRK